ncbi:hypothetical protein B4077_6171 [Bacillus cereus]|uniref:Uncharacterized protein n=1 Tax=Bacillus cereus TaxID=1396 RepID=A0A0G8EE50_BACCE|nr:hypothetical protein B4077_6171 [Bacillus cereus]
MCSGDSFVFLMHKATGGRIRIEWGRHIALCFFIENIMALAYT